MRRRSDASATPVKVRRIAMDLLAQREHSTAELRRKLTDRGCDSALVEDVLAGLARDGLLSDRRFAEEYINYRAQKGFGPVRIRAELHERGIDSELIEELLDPQDQRWWQLAQAAHRKRFGEAPPRDIRERAKQARFLQQRGFTAEQIRRVLRHDDWE